VTAHGLERPQDIRTLPHPLGAAVRRCGPTHRSPRSADSGVRFPGRLVSYSLHVGAASAARDSLGSVLGDAFGSPLGIAVQVAMLDGLVLLLRFDWVGLLQRRTGGRAAKGAAA